MKKLLQKIILFLLILSGFGNSIRADKLVLASSSSSASISFGLPETIFAIQQQK